MRGRTAARIASIITRQPGLSIGGLFGQVDDSPRAVYYHVKQLRDVGLIQSDAPTRYRNLRPAAELEALLSRVERNEDDAPAAAAG